MTDDSHYRDELRAAHDRIAQLEAERVTPPRPKRSPLVYVLIAFMAGVPLLLIGAFLAIWNFLEPVPRPPVAPRPCSTTAAPGSPTASGECSSPTPTATTTP